MVTFSDNSGCTTNAIKYASGHIKSSKKQQSQILTNIHKKHSFLIKPIKLLHPYKITRMFSPHSDRNMLLTMTHELLITNHHNDFWYVKGK